MRRTRHTPWMEHATTEELRQIGDMGRKAMRLRKEAMALLQERAVLIRKVSDRVRYKQKKSSVCPEAALIDLMANSRRQSP